MELSEKCKKRMYFLNKAMHEEKIDLHRLLERESAEGLTIVEVLQIYEELVLCENGNICTLVADPEFDDKGCLLYGEFARYEEVFDTTLEAKGTYFDTLAFAEQYAKEYKSDCPGNFDNYALMCFYDYNEVEYDAENDVREHIYTTNVGDIVSFLPINEIEEEMER